VKGFLRELFRTGLYKRNQGRIVRQVTFAVIAVTVALGCYRLSETLDQWHLSLRYGLPAVLTALGAWLGFRIVNYPEFADFLVAVEAEMNKVSWPTRSELFRASGVVLVTIFLLAGVLALFDVTWAYIFTELGFTPRA
jgi:preprotein translocase subunit SecE